MISTETINTKINMLPPTSQKEVLDFIDDLLEKSAKSNQKDKAEAWENWAKSHSNNTVIIYDSREEIYEDE
jgi:mRNA-degrading endonuclease RelE of RelBE toxin-antitoxin system